jgi:hypothetical protein
MAVWLVFLLGWIISYGMNVTPKAYGRALGDPAYPELGTFFYIVGGLLWWFLCFWAVTAIDVNFHDERSQRRENSHKAAEKRLIDLVSKLVTDCASLAEGSYESNGNYGRYSYELDFDNGPNKRVTYMVFDDEDKQRVFIAVTPSEVTDAETTTDKPIHDLGRYVDDFSCALTQLRQHCLGLPD